MTDITLYQRAFTHKSALKRYTLDKTYETLEFMGDSVLGFVITKMLFDRHESRQEGCEVLGTESRLSRSND